MGLNPEMARRILVQAGHVEPRAPEQLSLGTYREQEFNLAVQDRLCARLGADPAFEPIPCPGDIPDGIEVDAALYLHGNGFELPRLSGYSFGYPQATPPHTTLASLVEAEFERIPGRPRRGPDNSTAGMRGYYSYSLTATCGPKLLIEHGFLTNRAERDWMFANLDELAAAEHRALRSFFGSPAKR